MKIAETLGKSLEEVVQLSVVEIMLWANWFGLKADNTGRMQDGGKTANNHRTRR